jgi:hypothetical protein
MEWVPIVSKRSGGAVLARIVPSVSLRLKSAIRQILKKVWQDVVQRRVGTRPAPDY